MDFSSYLLIFIYSLFLGCLDSLRVDFSDLAGWLKCRAQAGGSVFNPQYRFKKKKKVQERLPELHNISMASAHTFL
jgi:hypothetical protein